MRMQRLEEPFDSQFMIDIFQLEEKQLMDDILLGIIISI